MGCSWCDLDNSSNYFIYASEHFNVYLSEDQSLLGRLILVLNRHASSLSDLTSEEIQDFFSNVKIIEKALAESFGATMFNWSCLMNNSYKKQPIFPHVHWHCRPRYAHDVSFAGQVFSDPDFAHHYNNKRKLTVSSEVQHMIITSIRTSIKNNLTIL
ncbi:MAG: HIT family protein [Candidatus Heimdallarchaeaceae archaeon]